MTIPCRSDNLGQVLAERLGLPILGLEGHDPKAACIACPSSDAFRLHQELGVSQCYSCGRSWSPFQLATVVLQSRQRAKELMLELNVFAPRPSSAPSVSPPVDAIAVIAVQKGVTRESLVAFGAKKTTSKTIQLPAYGPDGKACTTFTLSSDAGKGLFENGKPAGLFFPHEANHVRLPKPGETWHLVEGPKDAAALHDMGLLACGINNCRLNPKFAPLFAGVDVVLVPDRDRPGVDGANRSANVLHGIASSIRIAELPAELKPSAGEDVRDILRRPNGMALVEQAIAEAPPAADSVLNGAQPNERLQATAQVQPSAGEPLTFTVEPAKGRSKRLIIAKRGELEHRDQIDTNSSAPRERFLKKLSVKFNIDPEELVRIAESVLVKLADQADQQSQESSSIDDGAASQATLVASFAVDWSLWHTPAQEAFATIPVGDHLEHWPVRSDRLAQHLTKEFYVLTGEAVRSDTLNAALNLIVARAMVDGEEQQVFVRVAEHGGNVYLDLCNSSWQVVEITPSGWQIMHECPVRFRRSRGMLPLPAPVSGGTIAELRPFVNVGDENWPLVVGWLIAALHCRGPYPLLGLFAQQGSGKSTTARWIRSLIDPSAVPPAGRAQGRPGSDDRRQQLLVPGL